MAGILANSLSVTMLSGDTLPDNTVSGYVTEEQVVLGASPAPVGATYLWSMAGPPGTTIRDAFDQPDIATPTFTPNAPGWYTITCTVNSTTTYVLLASVTATAAITTAEAIRVPPKTDASIITPPSGSVLFYSAASNSWRVKDSTGLAHDLDSPNAFQVTATGAGGVVVSIPLADNSSLQTRITVTGLCTLGTDAGSSMSFAPSLAAKRLTGAATVALVGTASIATWRDPAFSALTVTVAANAATGRVDVTLPGVAGDTIQYGGTITQARYPL